jgi:predicted SAM-dependent methyltransferase
MSFTLPFKQGDKIIELGGGTVPVFRPNLDVRAAENVDIVADFDEPLPVPDKEYDGVFSKFCIEHVSWRKVKMFMQECCRILKDNGTAVFITANTQKQMEWVLDHDDWDDLCSCIIFGDQDYEDNTHKNSLNPKYAIRLLTEVGFTQVTVFPWGDLGTDMMIEAKKIVEEGQTSEERKSLFDQHYFNGGGKVGGYAYEGYWDYPVHWVTFNKLMELKPESVLEIGAARGYLVRRFEQAGIKAAGVEISKHCHLTRVTDAVKEFDVCTFPWPFADKEFDLCYSIAVMEHIPGEHIPKVLAEIDRVSKRGIHGIDFGENDDGFDKTHCSLHTKEWWEERAPKTQQVVDKEDMEKGHIATAIPPGDEKLKLNIGSFTTMYHNGWLNMDVAQLGQWADRYQYKFVHMDARQKMRLGENTVDLVACCHMLEHLTWEEGLGFLKECYRVMKPGAVMRVSVPDAEKITNYYRNGQLGMFDEINVVSAKNPCQSFKFWSLLFEGHRIAYDGQSLLKIGEEAGFKVKRCKFNEGNKQILAETFDLLPDLTIWVEFTKLA